jgi:hypothetical protein
MTQWISDQHYHSVPEETKSYTYFCRFLKAITVQLRGVVEEMTSLQTTRKEAVNRLTTLLRGCLSTSMKLGNLRFLSQQIVSDIEEIFDFPFGEVNSDGVEPGIGSEQGHAMLLNGGDIVIRGSRRFSSTLSSVVSYMEQRVSDEDLKILGYRRLMRDKNPIVNAVNGRPFNTTDAEHFLCKGWLIAKQTYPVYANVAKPHFAKPHCHPLKNGKKTIQSEDVTVIMKEIITTYESSDRQMEEPPRFCLMASERHGTKTCVTLFQRDRYHNTKRQRPTLRLTGSSDESSTTEESM